MSGGSYTHWNITYTDEKKLSVTVYPDGTCRIDCGFFGEQGTGMASIPLDKAEVEKIKKIFADMP